MKEDQFQKLFQYMTERFDTIDASLEQKANAHETHQILDTLDSLSKRLEISDDERIVMGEQLARIHEWVEQAASRIDLKFTH